VLLQRFKQKISVRRVVAFTLLTALVTVTATGVVRAQSITQSYSSDVVLQKGIIVRQADKDPTKVQALTAADIEKMFGVVVNANDSPVTLSGAGQTVYVATVGQYDVLVSDQNTPIKKGDYITISNLDGIGMKADLTQKLILGKAAENFDGKTGVITTSELKDSAGGSRKVNVGRIAVDMNISKNPAAKSDAGAPTIFSKIGQAIAGKSVSPAKIYLGIVIFILGGFVAGATLYAGIRSSIYSIGRNPLSKKSILRGLLQVIFTSLIIFAASLIGVYLLLKL